MLINCIMFVFFNEISVDIPYIYIIMNLTLFVFMSVVWPSTPPTVLNQSRPNFVSRPKYIELKSKGDEISTMARARTWIH